VQDLCLDSDLETSETTRRNVLPGISLTDGQLGDLARALSSAV